MRSRRALSGPCYSPATTRRKSARPRCREAVWDLLIERLAARGRTDQVRLSPPGFGALVPQEWTATVEEYRNWLVAELEKIGEPVDLVGHDWVAATCSTLR